MSRNPDVLVSIFDDQVTALAVFCAEHLALDSAKLPEEYFYQDLSFCVIDAVYSIGVKYGGVRNVVTRYCDYFHLQKFRETRDRLPATGEQESLSKLVERMSAFGIEGFAFDIFKNKQRTSARGGILKADAVFRFANALLDNGIRFLQDVPPRVFDAGLETALRQIRGQSSGISTSYFFMLAGADDLVKPDRWIKRFLNRCLDTDPDAREIQVLLSSACEKLRTNFPHLKPRLLDNVIWNYEREKT